MDGNIKLGRIKMSKIRFENKYGSVEITTPNDDMTIMDVRDELLKPLLLAQGYASENVEDLFGEE